MNIVYGGSFNPPTNAHKMIIENLYKIFKPENIIVVPVGDSYTKMKVIEYKHRFNMAKLLDERITVSTLENSDTYKGTFHLLNELSKKYDDLHYVIGSDNLIHLDEWIDYKKLLKKYKFIVFNRHNIDVKDVIMEKYYDYARQFTVINVDYPISSTKFRATKNRDLLPKEIWNYIVENELYGVKKWEMDF